MLKINKITKVSGLIPTILFGPVKSRRLGNSLGINLLPPHQKICQFNCPYCECGFTDVVLSRQAIKKELATFPTKEKVMEQITEALILFTSHHSHYTVCDYRAIFPIEYEKPLDKQTCQGLRNRTRLTALSSELLLELLDTTRGVHKPCLTGVNRVRS